MRIPSYLSRNRFGSFYFRVVFPSSVCAILGRKETRKSLKTYNKSLAVSMSVEFQQINQHLFNKIIRDTMKWGEVRKILDRVADHLFNKYVEKVESDGFDFEDRYSLAKILPEAYTFIKPKKDKWPYLIHWDLNSKKMQNRADFEASFYKEPAVVEFVDRIVAEHELKIGKDDDKYKEFCLQTLQMLYLLDKRKEQYQEQTLYGEGAGINHGAAIEANKQNMQANKTLQEVIDLYSNQKINIDKTWAEQRTRKGYLENLNRISEIYEYISGSSKTPISEYDKETAREVKRILSIIPSNLKKKYPHWSLSQVINKCEKGEIAKTDEERLYPSTINTYAILINSLFNYAKDEGFVAENHFSKLKVPKKIVIERKPFTDYDLNKFFNTKLFMEKDFPANWSWRYWVPIIMMYTGARVEEICQLYLDDIDDYDGVLCFNIREKIDQETGKRITSIKNKQSERLIPIHSTLKKIGLIKYIEWLRKNNEHRLFPTLKNVNNKGEYKKVNPPVSKWFNENDQKQNKTSYLSRCGICEEGKVLYCFRHTVETHLINHQDNIENDKIDRLMGHIIKSTGRSHYGKYNASTILEVVEKIEYPDAGLPWHVNQMYNEIKFPWQVDTTA